MAVCMALCVPWNELGVSTCGSFMEGPVMMMANARCQFVFCPDASMFVLQIMRSFSTAEKVTGANHYVLRVSPGTDYALMISFCVVIDELFND
jgi:hypothetical protein